VSRSEATGEPLSHMILEVNTDINADSISHNTRNAYHHFLLTWPFEWFMTIRLPNAQYEYYLKQVRTALVREIGQICYVGVFVDANSGPHVHLLLLGRCKATIVSRSLRDINATFWVSKINSIVKDRKGCEIRPIANLSELERAISYILSPRNTPTGGHEFIPPWGRIAKTEPRLKEAENDRV